MASRLAFGPLLLIALVVSATPVLASVPAAGKPSITITSPANGAAIHGSTVTIHVSVSNFKLVPPIYINPPLLPGNQGHIHYVLDALSNFVATRDARASLSHTWINVSPGPHTLIAYLATSQHALFPGTNRASVHVLVDAASAPKAAVHAGGGSMVKLAMTGGGASESQSPPNVPGALAGIACLLAGIGLLAWRRVRT